MFTFNPDMARDDNFEDGDEAFDTTNLPKEDEEEGGDNIVVRNFSFLPTPGRNPLIHLVLCQLVPRAGSG